MQLDRHRVPLTRETYLKDVGMEFLMKGHAECFRCQDSLMDGCSRTESTGHSSLEDVFAPAISLCEEGFPVSHRLAGGLKGENARFAAEPDSRAVFTNDGKPIAAGQLLANPNLGTTLQKIAKHGRDVLYKGEIAEAIGEFSRAYDGLLTAEDLANYHAHWAEPIHVNYRGYEVYEMPPNSSGHILLQELNMVELF